MPILPVPIFNPVYRNIAEEQLSDESSLLVDGYLNERGGTVGRPGLESWLDIGLGSNATIQGLYWWPHKGCVIAVASGNIFKITFSNGAPTKTDLTGDTLSSTATPVFDTDGTYCFIAAGGRVVYTNGTASTAYLADGDAPTSVSHLAYLDDYLLVNNANTNQVHFSSVSDSLSWAASDFFSAAGNADYVTAFHVFNREMYLFGPITTEIWENDGTSPFARVPGGFIQIGTIAPDSIVVTNKGLYFLDDRKHIRKLQGTNHEKVSTPYDKDISNFSQVTDCVGYQIELDGRPFILWQFPTEGKSLLYDFDPPPDSKIVGPNWAEWTYWNSGQMARERWIGNSYCYAPNWGLHLVGGRKNSLIYKMSPDVHTDNGEEIRTQRKTGHISYGTNRSKRCKKISLRLKRGENGASSPLLMLRWNDDNKGWSNEHHISLGSAGDREIIKEVFARGIYRSRQYELTATDAVSVMFADAQEELDVLSR